MVLAPSSLYRPKSAAENLIEELRLNGVLPVPLEAIAKQKGYDCQVFDPETNPKLKDVGGMVNHAVKKIFLNGGDPVQRQRFTLAHEIGHILLHAERSVVDFRKNLDNPSTTEEIEANRFAADLLMPSIPYLKAWFESGGDYNFLAKKFGVSVPAAKIRATTFKLDRP